MKRVVVVLAIVSMLLAGCNAEQKHINDDGVIKIGFIPETMTVERWQRDREVFVAKAKELGAEEVLVKNAYEDTELQKSIAQDMIEAGVDVLVIIAYDKDALVDIVEYAHQNNVKVIAYDRLIRNANVDLYISFDNYRVGELMGMAAYEAIPRGNYMILNGPETDNNVFMIRKGYMSVIQPAIDSGEIVVTGETWVSAWRDEVSYAYMSEKIGTVDFDVIIAGNDRVAEGAINALSENRMSGKIFVTGQDAEIAACQRIVEGTQGMTVYKPIDVLAEGAAEYAVKMALGEDIGECESISDGKYLVDYIAYEPISVNAENMVETVIKDGFYTIEQVYANVPKDQWPDDID
ncbi:MAG: substrate-binding domain-containing protein [Eubacteriales bacterium]